jgi:hypothetical protein
MVSRSAAPSRRSDVVTIVSGLPRSGTSMMMRMLERGGMPVLVDGIRTADEDNPRGYYEFERVKQIEHDAAWLDDAGGKAVKMISGLLQHLPAGRPYKVIFMRREMDEILASQRRMLVRRGEPTDRIQDDEMAALFHKHLAKVEAWLDEQPNIQVLYVSYNDMLEDPAAQVAKVAEFLDAGLDPERMVAVIDPSLYRQRQTED